jgi:hypothetical protein
VSWLWPGRLPLGKLVILEGDPGLGKSLIALDLCARLSTGRPFPDGSPGPGRAGALVFSGEDDAADTVGPRLKALGADLGGAFEVHRRGADNEEERLCFPTHTGQLEKALVRTQARLVVLDPITAFLAQSVQLNSESSVRQALAPLQQLAQKHACTVMMHRHLNKEPGGRAVYRGSNSIAFLAVCRSAWLAARDPQDPARCVLAQVKNNLGPPQPSLAYEVIRQEGDRFQFSWLGAVAWTADQLLAAASQRSPLSGPRDHARDFLQEFLQDGPRTSREVWEAARVQDLSERTLSRAKRELSIRSERLWDGSKLLSYWLLPGQRLPTTTPPPEGEPDLQELLDHLCEEYPPSTPLDDL